MVCSTEALFHVFHRALYPLTDPGPMLQSIHLELSFDLVTQWLEHSPLSGSPDIAESLDKDHRSNATLQLHL